MKKKIISSLLILSISLLSTGVAFADSITYTYNNANQLETEVRVNGTTKTTILYFYDDNGNLLNKITKSIEPKTGNEIEKVGLIVQ